MFQPQVFREDRAEVMRDLIRQQPFGILVSSATGDLAADHLPFVLHDDDKPLGTLHGHIGAGNPLIRQANDRCEVLTIFQGPQSYISPSWYPSKAAHGKVVPTWNYVVVHARGLLRVRREHDWLLQHLDDLTRQHEGARPDPWSVSDAPEDFIQRQLRGLVGFEIAITDLQGTWKLSQNKTADDAAGVVEGLREIADEEKSAMAALVTGRARQATPKQDETRLLDKREER